MNDAYVFDPKMVDVAVLRKEAVRTLAREGLPTTIHHHKYGEPCDNQTHEVFER